MHVGLDCRSSTELEKTETKHLEGIHRVSHWHPGKNYWLHRCLSQTYLLVLKVSWKGKGGSVVHCWNKDLVAEILGVVMGLSCHRAYHFWQQCLPHSTDCWLQGWKDSDQEQPARQEKQPHKAEIQPHLSTGCPKLFLSSESHLYTHSLTWPLPTEGQNPALPTSVKVQIPHTRKPT